jgi:hypothetical protein
MSIAQCSKCLDVLESTHRHDFVRCSCGNSFLDGGDDYFRGGGSLISYIKDYSISDKKYFNSGREYERERIIKLLEPHAEHRDCELGCYPEDCSAPSYAYAIELIKGETDE